MGSSYTPSAAVQSTTASPTNDISIVLIWRSSFESLTRRRSGASQKGVGVLYTKETLVVLGSGVKANSIPPVTYLHRSINSKQPLSMIPDRSLLPRSSRLLNKNISQKCSRDDRKMTLGGLHGHGMVQTSGVGPPMAPWDQVIHHQQRCRAQQQVI